MFRPPARRSVEGGDGGFLGRGKAEEPLFVRYASNIRCAANPANHVNSVALTNRPSPRFRDPPSGEAKLLAKPSEAREKSCYFRWATIGIDGALGPSWVIARK